jgi:hypothetical protein
MANCQAIWISISTDAKLNLYLFLGKLSIDAECRGLGARKYKNNCAQALSAMFYVFAERQVPEQLSEALEDLIEALNYAEEAQGPTDELVKAKNAFVSARESLDLMDQHGFRRSAIVQDVAARLQQVIADLAPGRSPGGPAPSPS